MSKISPPILADYLEQRKEAGLLPEHHWKGKRKRSLPASVETNAHNKLTSSSISEILLPDNYIQETQKAKTLEQIREVIGDCTRCRLSQGRTKIVFGVGNPQAELMFVGEAPGRDEDLKGEPFVGRAGQLLTKIIEAMGFQRSDIYIANVVKCRPPENRNPSPDEIATCSPFLFKQIELIQPKVIVGLGTFAVQTLLATEDKITGLRGKIHPWPNATVQKILNIQLPLESIKFMPTYHPAFLLRNPSMKKPVWEDMKIVMQELGKPISG